MGGIGGSIGGMHSMHTSMSSKRASIIPNFAPLLEAVDEGSSNIGSGGMSSKSSSKEDNR